MTVFDLGGEMFGDDCFDLSRKGMWFGMPPGDGTPPAPSTPAFLSQQVITKIDTDTPLSNPLGVSVPTVPSVLVSTLVIAETHIDNINNLSVPPVPGISVSTEVETI